MTFPDEIVVDVEAMHRDFARNDITRTHRVVTAVSVTGSTPTYTSAVTVITGVFTIIDTALNETVFGGLEDCDAVLMVLPAVDVEYEDLITVDGIDYRVEEIRNEDVQGTGHQKFCRLVKTS
jgi:hypothetical protein